METQIYSQHQEKLKKGAWWNSSFKTIGSTVNENSNLSFWKFCVHWLYWALFWVCSLVEEIAIARQNGTHLRRTKSWCSTDSSYFSNLIRRRQNRIRLWPDATTICWNVLFHLLVHLYFFVFRSYVGLSKLHYIRWNKQSFVKSLVESLKYIVSQSDQHLFITISKNFVYKITITHRFINFCSFAQMSTQSIQKIFDPFNIFNCDFLNWDSPGTRQTDPSAAPRPH